jgi:3-oxoacyl-[acyl-carrier protein] reductase
MDLGLTNKVALVLASSGGLGYATAYTLAAEGAHVLVSSRSLERARTAAEAIKQDTSAQVDAFEVDVADVGALAKLFSDVQATIGGIDILVCNAGGPPPGSFNKLCEDQWDAAYQLTMQSVVRSVRLALPQMQARGGGAILALASSSVPCTGVSNWAASASSASRRSCTLRWCSTSPSMSSSSRRLIRRLAIRLL